MSKFFAVVISLILAGTVFAACAPEPVASAQTEATSKTGFECEWPVTDNNHSWSFAVCIPVDPTVYIVEVEVVDEIRNNTELNASGGGFVFGGYGSFGMRMWQDGKGLLPVRIVNLSPAFRDIVPGDHIILKTLDLKAMALPPGALVKFVCNSDTEILSPPGDPNQITPSEERYTYELDECRMVTPEYLPGN